ncbi:MULTISPECIES: flagellar hook-basal body complex protein FliE [Sphingomonas]|uniref:Flagellar hook-basal body complex protein FliE n=1 Tax=Edaphosphingomonas fennica TaxID=114404 RepID=A0A2T4I780_9SPHN|nr:MULTISPECIES: flagellar hook-basal body complex protein FliE [Sphingomonas]AGH49044.1 flagellar hook-basal body protein FliE [Sphingomonas sp. MM-1]MDX3885290.1 flagellar hook-basal body complex protein FliE [Sphingomonas sp.]PTD26948.1 flagellar hook-basal body complex protein FliE [Sphingomonas fennica]
MSIGVLDAAAAYGRAVNSIAPAAAGGASGGAADVAGAAAGAPGGGFGGMIENLVTEAATSLRTAEAASAQQVAGKGDLIDVVTAIGAAETALDTVVAVRDRVVNAYSEIMRMQI